MPAVESSMQTSDADCIAALREAANRLGKSPTKAEYEKMDVTPASTTITRKFGGWNAAKEAAGLKTFEQDENGGRDIQPKPDGVEIPTGKEWKELTSQQRWYYKNRQHRIEIKEKRRQSLHRWFYELKRDEFECSQCGESRPPALDFHHPNKKDKSVSKMVNDGHSKDSIREEIDRCLVLCANCHRKAHSKASNLSEASKEGAIDASELPEQSARKERREWLLSYKNESDGCQRCSVTDPHCLDFHHENEKQMGIGEMVSFSYRLREIRDEIEKCVLLCANCHRDEHFEKPTPDRYDTHK